MLNWNLRDDLHEWREGLRLYIMVDLLLHCNHMLRCYPSNELIHQETAISGTLITNGIKWLQEVKAVLIVPYGHRTEWEKKLAPNKNIYQLTGITCIKGYWSPYLFLTPEGWEGIAAQIEALGDHSLSNYLATRFSRAEALSNYPASVYTVGRNPLGVHEGIALKESLKVIQTDKEGKTPSIASKSKAVQQIESDPVWIAYAAGWDEQPLPPEVTDGLANFHQQSIEALRPGIEDGTYTLDDITGLTRESLRKPVKGGYRLQYVKNGLPEYLAKKQALAAQELQQQAALDAAAQNAAYQPFPDRAQDDEHLTPEERHRIIAEAKAAARGLAQEKVSDE